MNIVSVGSVMDDSAHFALTSCTSKEVTVDLGKLLSRFRVFIAGV
jgi:hypothetical protein